MTTNPRIAAVVGLFAVLVAGLMWMSHVPDEALVVYCAHDSIYSDEILNEFEDRTGIKLVVRYDTEATKSLGLVNLLLAEKDAPMCDVFWNNEVLGTMKLKRAGILRAYSKASSSRIPSRFRDPDGMWIGFGARMRIWIANTESEAFKQAGDSWSNALNATLNNTETDAQNKIGNQAAVDFSRIAMAKPLYGTTLTHYSILTREWGIDRLRKWHSSIRQQGLQEVNGNSSSKNIVANGQADFGWTDTDDYSLAVQAQQPVAYAPVFVGEYTICIPNSVAIIQGTQKQSAAEQLVDFLTSAEIEVRLANSRSRQIPLGDVDSNQLPPEVRKWKALAERSIDLNDLEEAHQTCLDWLQSEYSR